MGDVWDDFAAAVWHAKCLVEWRHPDAPRAYGLTRRQCLWHVRQHQQHIVNIAIRVENALRRMGGGSPEPSPVPKISKEIPHVTS